MAKIDEIQSQYRDGLLTKSGYVLMSIDALDLTAIDLVALSERLELPYGTIRDIILKLRASDRIRIPTLKGRRDTRV